FILYSLFFYSVGVVFFISFVFNFFGLGGVWGVYGFCVLDF
ncbi:hypothetical protein HMPREF1429_00945, partial [Helicobacter pylori GAM93Bi]